MTAARGELSFPRIFGIPAARAPIVAVLRRGPSDWTHVGRWDVASGVYEPGAWIRATVYAQRCDLSPDGRWFCYMTHKGRARWALGMTYVAISRLPWLTALAAWSTNGTWSRGAHFVDDPAVWNVPEPDEGDVTPLRGRVGMAVTAPAAFEVERRRGWTETAETPPRAANDMWDEQRGDRITLQKPRPGTPGRARLRVRGHFAAFRAAEPGPVVYEVAVDDEILALEGVQWADWDATGRLLVATASGTLQIRDGARPTEAPGGEVDLVGLRPEPVAPPAEARTW
jgi:hypothetical protein